ncbi:hypothetical protein CFK41_05335 [Brachybacterium ginsengisoli]|uniref:Uncharacterized protein n=1 Tax=Brachybacterium ginsengisoli TaxID=1331682 RepID=A0A291GVM3_9MICO|nr:hypothetical protein [Brachybacterium ginsengisoli]ATG54260.1 hypothetical protein CFK41_05335 [Brachybacterium ginsengisoli]
MLFTPIMAAAFGDWLEREQIRAALFSARPQLDATLLLDPDRPLLRIPLPGGPTIIVAKLEDGPTSHWIVGIPHPQFPTLQETRTLDELVEQVLAHLDSCAPASGRP